MHMAIGMHVHPYPDMPARFAARTTTRARWARGWGVAEIAERVMGCGGSGDLDGSGYKKSRACSAARRVAF